MEQLLNAELRLETRRDRGHLVFAAMKACRIAIGRDWHGSLSAFSPGQHRPRDSIRDRHPHLLRSFTTPSPPPFLVSLQHTRAEEVISLKVTLRGIRPPIWRRLEVPTRLSLGGLHDAIQAAMGWGGHYLYVFDVAGRSYGGSCHG
jgi:Plasmid pRiA4b ORF-3-like protein